MNYKNMTWTDIITPIVTLLSGAFGAKLLETWVKKQKAKTEIKEKDQLLTSLKSISAMDYYMTDVVQNTPVERMLVLMGHDSGNIPNPKHPYFAKAIWQKVKDDQHDEHLVRKYDSVRVDFAYIEMMVKILTDGFVKIKVDEMPNCFLKTVYQGEGVKYSEVYFIKQEQSHKIYYCSIATNKDNEYFDDKFSRSKIDLAINHLRQIFAEI